MACWNNREKNTGEIISIGVVELCLVSGTQLREAHYLVKPDHDEVSEFCTKLTGISQVMVNRQGRPLAAVLETLQKKFGGAGKVYVAWGEDGKYLDDECISKGIQSPITCHINASLLYRLRKRSKDGKSIGLIRAMNSNGLEFDGKAHNAIIDAKNLANLISHIRLL